MRNPPKRKRLGDEDIKSTFSLTSLRELERQLGDAMSQAGIAKEKREHGSKLKANGANRGSSGPKIYSLGDSYNRAMLKAIASEKSFSEVSASQIIKDSFVKFQRKLNADKLRSIYDEIKDIPRAKLDSYNLNLLCELKNVFLEIDRDEERSRKNAPRPLTAGKREAQLFEKHNESLSAQKTRRELNKPKPEERTNKRQRTNEDWWGGLTNNFAPVIDQVTNTILSAPLSFLGNFGNSFTKPEEQKKLVAVRDPMEEKEAEIYKPDSFKPSFERDRR